MSDDEIPENALINNEDLQSLIDSAPFVIDDGNTGEEADLFGWLHIPDLTPRSHQDADSLQYLMDSGSPDKPVWVKALCGRVEGNVGKYLTDKDTYNIDADFCADCATLHQVQQILNSAG